MPVPGARTTFNGSPMKSTAINRNSMFSSAQAWYVWGCVAAFYLYEMILRVSPSIMIHGLMKDFDVSSTSLGVLSSFYYFAYVPLQIPCGIIVDRLGTRKVVTFSALLCTIGALLFAESSHLPLAQFGRFLIGAGSACAFLSCLKVTAEWFPLSQFSLIAGLTTMMGTLGGTFGGRPLAMLVTAHGWRSTTTYMGLAGVVVTILCWIVIRDSPPLKQNNKKPVSSKLRKRDLFSELGTLVKNRQVWLIAIFGGLMYVPISAFTELWGVPYLMQIYGINSELASTASIMVFIGMAIGSSTASWFTDYYKSHLVVMKLSAISASICFISIVFAAHFPLWFTFSLLFGGGFCIGGQVLCFTCVKQNAPKEMSATAIGFTNAVVMMGGLIFQPLLGYILDLGWDGGITAEGVRHYTNLAYQVSIIAIPCCLLVSWLLLRFVRETYTVQD